MQLGLVTKRQPVDRTSTSVYELTERGESLRPVLDALYAWSNAVMSELPVQVD